MNTLHNRGIILEIAGQYFNKGFFSDDKIIHVFSQNINEALTTKIKLKKYYDIKLVIFDKEKYREQPISLPNEIFYSHGGLYTSEFGLKDYLKHFKHELEMITEKNTHYTIEIRVTKNRI